MPAAAGRLRAPRQRDHEAGPLRSLGAAALAAGQQSLDADIVIMVIEAGRQARRVIGAAPILRIR
jgi:hypothetical protein